MFLEVLQATKIYLILISRGCDPYTTLEQGHTRMRGFKNLQKSLEGSIGVLYGG